MKAFYSTIILALVSTFSFGQTSFEFYPNDTVTAILQPNTTVQYYIKDINLTGGPLTLGMEVVHNDIPQAFDGMVCVYGSCMGFIPPAGTGTTMDPVTADTAYVRLTINPLTHTGGGTLRVRVFDANNPSDGDTCTWIVQTAPVGISDNAQEDIFEFYPNPATDQLWIEAKDNLLERFEIITLDGKVLRNESLSMISTGVIDLEGIPTGVYFIRLTDAANRTSSKRLVIK